MKVKVTLPTIEYAVVGGNALYVRTNDLLLTVAALRQATVEHSVSGQDALDALSRQISQIEATARERGDFK